MQPHFFRALLEKYRKGETQVKESKLVDDWYDSFGEEFPVKDLRQKKALRNELHTSIQSRLTYENVPVRQIKPREGLLKRMRQNYLM